MLGCSRLLPLQFFGAVILLEFAQGYVENVVSQFLSFNQIAPLGQTLGGVVIFAIVFSTRLQEALWKQEGAKLRANSQV
jgi:hypothetical protein